MKTKTLEVAARIRAMKPGDIEVLKNAGERAKWLRESKTLRQAGVIKFQILTRKLGNGEFNAIAV